MKKVVSITDIGKEGVGRDTYMAMALLDCGHRVVSSSFGLKVGKDVYCPDCTLAKEKARDKPTDEAEESTWSRGRRSGLVSVLSHVVRELGYHGGAATKERLIVEREQAIAVLREVCEEHGDNDWPDNLNLVDIIDKHLYRHLGGGQ